MFEALFTYAKRLRGHREGIGGSNIFGIGPTTVLLTPPCCRRRHIIESVFSPAARPRSLRLCAKF
jgi:hypothetical protein